MLWILDKMVILPTLWGGKVVPRRVEMAEIRSFAVVLVFLLSIPHEGTCAPGARGFGSRIKAISLYDAGQLESGSPTIDVEQGVCGVAPDQTAEPFYDTTVSFKIYNAASSTLRIKNVSYRIRDSDGNGAAFRSKKLSPFGSVEVAPRSDATIYVLFADAESGGKRFAGKTSAIPSTLGIKNIKFSVSGSYGARRTITLSASTAVSFDNYNRCE